MTTKMELVYCTLCDKKRLQTEGTSGVSFNEKLCNPYLVTDVLKNGLQIIFLMRKILEIPQETCCTFLTEYGNPCSWIGLCDSCLSLVQEGRIIHDQMWMLQKQFKILQNKITNEITQSASFQKHLFDKDKMGVKETMLSFINKNLSQSNLQATKSSCPALLAACNDGNQVIIKDEVFSDISDGDTSDEDLSCPSWDLDTEPDEPQLTELMNSTKEQELNSDLTSNENCTSKPGETNDNSENVGTSEFLIQQAYTEPNQPLITEHAKRIENNVVPKNNKSKIPECKICGKVYRTKESLAKHEKRRHVAVQQYKCKICGEGYPFLSDLVRHERLHTGDRPFICDNCGKAFSTMSILNTHKKIHSEERHHKCNFCQKSFITASNLRVHERIHTGEKPYKCETCGEAFIQTNLLARHKRKHTGEKPFKCETCGEVFTHSGSLLWHQKKKHTGEKPHECKICGKCFITSSDLRCHERAHTGEKPFKCYQCDKAFAKAGTLNRHKKTHDTGEKLF